MACMQATGNYAEIGRKNEALYCFFRMRFGHMRWVFLVFCIVIVLYGSLAEPNHPEKIECSHFPV